MTKEQALELLTKVCAIYKGTLDEHQALQEALKTVSSLEPPQPVEPKK